MHPFAARTAGDRVTEIGLPGRIQRQQLFHPPIRRITGASPRLYRQRHPSKDDAVWKN